MICMMTVNSNMAAVARKMLIMQQRGDYQVGGRCAGPCDMNLYNVGARNGVELRLKEEAF